MSATIRVLFVMSLLMLLFGSQNSIAQTVHSDSIVQKLKAHYQSVEQLEINTNSGIPRSVRGKLAKNTNVSDLAQSRQFLRNSKSLFRINEATDDFTMKKVSKDNLNMTHAKLQQTYKNIPVWGSELILHGDGNNTVIEVNGRFTPDLNLDVAASISSASALNIALADLGPAEYRWQNTEREKVIKEVFKDESKTWKPTPELVVAPRDGDFEKGEYKLTWIFTVAVDGVKLGNWSYFIDAKTGEILRKFNSMRYAIGTGSSNKNNCRLQKRYTRE